MKYFVLVYNLLTLHKAIVYSKKEWGIEDTYFIYTTMVTEPPKGLVTGMYNSHIVNHKGKTHNWHTKRCATIGFLLSIKYTVSDIVSYIKSIAHDYNEDLCIVVFKDTPAREALLIDRVKEIYNKVVVVMIEEGLSLYADRKQQPNSFRNSIKSILFRLTGIPLISLYNTMQIGYNPATDTIICSHPKLLEKTKLGKQKRIIKQIDMFTKENCDYFIREIMLEEIPEITYDYVFLSQPLFSCRDNELAKEYDAFLWHILGIMSKYGRVLIKPHPLDSWNYSKYESERVDICDGKLTKFPFECLMGHFGSPQTVSLYSSAGCNIESEKHNIFLYGFFPKVVSKTIFSDDLLIAFDIDRCNDYREFEMALFIRDRK